MAKFKDIFAWVRARGGKQELRELLYRVLDNQEKIMATQAELAEQLTAAAAQAEKIGGETRTLLTRIEELLVELANAGAVTPELQAAADAVKAQLQVVDDLVPDAAA